MSAVVLVGLLMQEFILDILKANWQNNKRLKKSKKLLFRRRLEGRQVFKNNNNKYENKW